MIESIGIIGFVISWMKIPIYDQSFPPISRNWFSIPQYFMYSTCSNYSIETEQIMLLKTSFLYNMICQVLLHNLTYEIF